MIGIKKDRFRYLLKTLDELEGMIVSRESVGNPATYGMPDLLFGRGETQGEIMEDPVTGIRHYRREKLRGLVEETDEAYRRRQDETLRSFIEENLYIVKDTKQIRVKTFPPMMKFMADLFFRRTSRVILWKGRGCGGSLAGAIVIWLCMIYHRMSFIDMAGAGEQAKIVYEYVVGFFGCIPGLKQGIMDGAPLISQTKLMTGVRLKCILPDQIAVTEDGFRRFDSIKPGERVFDGMGRFGVVKKVIRQRYVGPIVKIVPTGWPMGYWVTDDHQMRGVVVGKQDRMWVQAQGWRKWRDRCFERGDWIEAGRLNKGDLVEFPRMDRCPCVKRVVLEDHPRGRKRLQEVVIDREFCRFMGYWLADGSVSGRVVSTVFDAKDVVALEDFLQLVRRKFEREPCKVPKPGSIDVRFSHAGLASWLKENCGTGDKKHVPGWILNGAFDEELEGILVGAFRGDGSESEVVGERQVKQGMIFTNTSPRLTQDVFLCALSLGMIVGVRQVAGRKQRIRGKWYDCKPQWVVQANGLACERLAAVVGIEFSGKKAKSGQHGFVDSEKVYRPIRKTETGWYDGEVIDLEMEEDPSFCLPYGIAHNCITTSEKQARGKHMAGFLGDEAAMEDEKSERAMRAAMQGPLSEEDSIVILLSTFHVPVGLFQMYWDDADDMGFGRYRWDVFDAMKKCTAPIDCKKCYLTELRQIEVKEETGKASVKQDVWVGCNGKARNSDGYLTREMVIEDKKMNRGTQVFEVEFCNQRPQWMRPVFDEGLVQAAIVDEIAYRADAQKCVGIDWGLESEGSMCLVLGVRTKDHVGIVEAVATSGMLANQIAEILAGWFKEYGDFEVWADQSHPFENREIEEAGFIVQRIDFRKYRDFGVKNVQRYFAFKRVKIIKELALIADRIKAYRKDKYGRPIKDINSHVADAIMCMLLRFPLMEEFPDDIRSGAEEIQGALSERPGTDQVMFF